MADKLVNKETTARPLKGKTVVLFFPESSIRTRVTFEKGIQELDANTILFPPSALDKKEKIEDVIGHLENWIDAVAVRHSDIEVVKNIGEYGKIPVINAMTSENHPCPPFFQGEEVSADVINSDYLVVGYGFKKHLAPLHLWKM